MSRLTTEVLAYKHYTNKAEAVYDAFTELLDCLPKETDRTKYNEDIAILVGDLIMDNHDDMDDELYRTRNVPLSSAQMHTKIERFLKGCPPSKFCYVENEQNKLT